MPSARNFEYMIFILTCVEGYVKIWAGTEEEAVAKMLDLPYQWEESHLDQQLSKVAELGMPRIRDIALPSSIRGQRLIKQATKEVASLALAIDEKELIFKNNKLHKVQVPCCSTTLVEKEL